jgi:hypothetical protein
MTFALWPSPGFRFLNGDAWFSLVSFVPIGQEEKFFTLPVLEHRPLGRPVTKPTTLSNMLTAFHISYNKYIRTGKTSLEGLRKTTKNFSKDTRWPDRIFFLIGIVGVGVQLRPLGTAATSRPIVPAPGDYDDGKFGGMIRKGNRSTRRKPAPAPLYTTTNPTRLDPGSNPGLGGKPAKPPELRHGLALIEIRTEHLPSVEDTFFRLQCSN